MAGEVQQEILCPALRWYDKLITIFKSCSVCSTDNCGLLMTDQAMTQMDYTNPQIQICTVNLDLGRRIKVAREGI